MCCAREQSLPAAAAAFNWTHRSCSNRLHEFVVLRRTKYGSLDPHTSSEIHVLKSRAPLYTVYIHGCCWMAVDFASHINTKHTHKPLQDYPFRGANANGQDKRGRVIARITTPPVNSAATTVITANHARVSLVHTHCTVRNKKLIRCQYLEIHTRRHY